MHSALASLRVRLGLCAPLSTHSGWPRRDFLKSLTASAAWLSLRPWNVMAGPFTRADFTRLVPEDKRLRPEWVASLAARGARTVYRGAELDTIGMPIGGLCAGQLYLGGDGKLWHWDIFNQRIGTGAEHYAKPMSPSSPLDHGFALRVTAAGQSQQRPLSRNHWRDVSFVGEYPIGYVTYDDPDCPVAVSLQAFSPFIPLNTDDSSLPATVFEFTLQNQASQPLDVQLAGWLENAVCRYTGEVREGFRRNRLVRGDGMLRLECTAEEPPTSTAQQRPDITFDGFERTNYDTWISSGTAFGSGPVELAKIPEYQGELGGKGKRVVNTHGGAPGNTVEQRDAARGKLTSQSFTIERNFITFLVGGGGHKGRTCMNLMVEGRLALSSTGQNDNRMQPVSWDVRRWMGKAAHLEIVDEETGPWGNIGIDDIVFSDQPRTPAGLLAEQTDFGSLCLALLEHQPDDFGSTALPSSEMPPGLFLEHLERQTESARERFGTKLCGALTRKLTLAAGAAAKVTFVLSWHFPNLKLNRLPPGRHYAQRFASASQVAAYVAANFARLAGDTRLWHDTWYDSTLPYWFLDRTFLNTSILASSTCHRLATGRFYAWEGVGCCEGTCGHVWQYAHAVARLFPDLERRTREQVDFGSSLQPDGAIHFRGEFNTIPAIDAQAGTILRALREHQMSADDAFLKRNWPAIKKATEWLIAKDSNGDGLIEGNQHNTLDTDWFGPVAWLSGLYLAALLAAETMARELGDAGFATRCRNILASGSTNLVTQLFDGEYFVNKPDPKHADAINSGTGCEIDQVFGQSWAFQVGLPRVLPHRETVSALKSLWRFNFTPDVGPYRDAYKAGRWYAMAGEAGLLMCTFPRSDWDYAQAKGKGPDWAAGYFNECMNGFEYQVAGHMLWEGLVTEGLAITRAIHDRYHPSRRNPFNEIECGDHYARSMASYGVFLAACGFSYHGPEARLGFAPRLSPENFRCAFTSAEGWGTFAQSVSSAEVLVRWGRLRLRTVELIPPGPVAVLVLSRVKATLDGQPVRSEPLAAEGRLRISFHTPLELSPGQKLAISF